MTVETATYISDLNASYPGSTDDMVEGDNHLRLLKSTVKATFPNVSGAVSATHTQLSYVTGVTSAIQTQLDAKSPLLTVATNKLIGRQTAGTGAYEAIGLGAGVELDGSSNLRIADSGVTMAKVAADAVTNAKLANVATATFKGRSTAGTGDPEDLSSTQATALLDVMAASTKGLVPAPSGSPSASKFLSEAGTFLTVNQAINAQSFTASGTWTKPASGTIAFIRGWGAGGSGRCGSSNANIGGGGGGGYNERWILLSLLGTTETITVGVGGTSVTGSGTNGNPGTDSTFGAWLTAKAGLGGASATGGVGGGVGAAEFFQTAAGSTVPHTFSGSAGANYNAAANNAMYGGGGGGSVLGGGASDGTAGTSLHGGNGGTGHGGGTGSVGNAGTAPGGGGGGGNSGGSSGAGARGQIEVYVF